MLASRFLARLFNRLFTRLGARLPDRLHARLGSLVLLPAGLMLATAVQAADVGISLSLVQPGVYGRIDIGPQVRPSLVHAEPVWIHRPRHMYRMPPPVYLYAPPHHVRHWRRYCAGYGACGQPVLFIQDRWVRDWHGHRGWDRGHRHGHGWEHGHGHDRRHGRDRDDDRYAPSRRHD